MTAVAALPWYAAQTLAGQEVTAAIHIRRLNHWVYLPQVPYRRPSGERGARPRFPGYVLINLDLGLPGWHRINLTPGVVHLLPRYLDRPMPLPTGFVERLMTQPDDDVLIEFREHELVRIICGPACGVLAAVERQDGDRLRVRSENGTAINTRTADVERA